MSTKNKKELDSANKASTLYSLVEPTLPLGKYTVSVTNSLTGFGTTDLNNEAVEFLNKDFEQTFWVGGAQFSILPADIFAQHPANNTVGNYSKQLPYIIFNRESLPWTRSFEGKNGKKQSWMALMLLTKEELACSIKSDKVKSPSNPAIISQTVAKFLADKTSNVVKTNLTKDNVQEQFWEKMCESIIIEAKTFNTYQKVFRKSSLFCHTRGVDLTHSPTHIGLNADEPPVEGNNNYASILANFYPETLDKDYFVHLVSLEGLGKYINTGLPTDTKGVQLISLYNWQFSTAKENTDTFKQAVQQLVKNEAGELLKAEDLLLRSPIGPKSSDRSKQGFITKSYTNINGSVAEVEYRSPFVPLRVPLKSEIFNKKSLKTATNYLQFDRKKGVLLAEYAVAFDLGKLLALSNEAFRKASAGFRKKFRHALRREQEIANTIYSHHGQLAATQVPDISNDWKSFAFEHYFNLEPTKAINESSSEQTGTEEDRKPLNIADILQSYGYSEEGNGTSPLNEKAQQFLSSASDEVDTISHHFAKLELFNFIPFNYLVPSATFLPVDSIRFFYINENWMRSLYNGATKVGVQHSLDEQINALFSQALRNKGRQVALNDRRKKLGFSELKTPLEGDQSIVKAGLLIRSSFIASFPGISIIPDEGVNILRMEKIAEDLLICLFDKIPTKLAIQEADHGLQFGNDNKDQIINSGQTSSAKAAKAFTKERLVLTLRDEK